MSLRVVDLFSGAGGLALGFRAAGCEIVAAVDVNAVCGETFRANFERLQPLQTPRVLVGMPYDLEGLDLGDICVEPPDILTGGPPCQGYSRLGRGKLDSLSDEGFEGDPRNQLYRRFLDAVRTWRPRAVVMENVPGMLSMRGMNYAALVTEELAEEGYRVGYAQLNAVWYGVPQYRERLFFIGFREDLGTRPEAPPATH
jgi:DNA (cytosine-5)-methyltransferase 1